MNDQKPPQSVTQITLNGGVYPNEDGTWRVCCWLGGIRTEEEAKRISEWLANLMQNNISRQPPQEAPSVSQ